MEANKGSGADPAKKRAVDLPGLQIVFTSGAAIATLASVLYNWAYFYVLGYFRADFVTLNDAITSALTWIPPTGFLMLLGGYHGTFGLFEKAILKPTRSSFVRWAESFLILFAAGLYALFGFKVAGLAVTIATLAAMSMAHNINFEQANISYGPRIQMALLFAPLVIGFSVADGMRDGYTARASTQFDTRITTSDGINEVALFRYFERGVLYRRKDDRRIVFSPWEKVRQVSNQDSPDGMRSIICEDLGWLCFPNVAAIADRKNKP